MPFHLGLDVGSTTAKAVLLEEHHGRPVFLRWDYRRHDAQIAATVQSILSGMAREVGDVAVTARLTGSAAMGLAERTHLSFVQEVQAACLFAMEWHPDAEAVLDIGGEDSKLVFLDAHLRPDARMNGGCAGGTGAFLDQMAALLGLPTSGLEELASQGDKVHPIASRCGVFAKTDVQNLLSGGVEKSQVALSVFHAMASQVIGTLARGRTTPRRVMMTGGPLSFLPTLRAVFCQCLGIDTEDAIVPERSELVCAAGAALSARGDAPAGTLKELAQRLAATGNGDNQGTLRPLFLDEADYRNWAKTRLAPTPRGKPSNGVSLLFLGIDSGSTTSKLVVVDGEGRVVAGRYEMNLGDSLGAVARGLELLRQELEPDGGSVQISGAAATGYGETLVKTALGLDLGVVETAAHLRAATHFVPTVNFILDIGGQDMKAMFVKDGRVQGVEVNEACSSGCGSFLQTFAESLSVDMDTFAEGACLAQAPRDLGSRCTVFMNSMVKQALREGAKMGDIAAGLSYSVVRNCLHKVLKLRDMEPLGETIVVQGGTFLNPAVHRAFEILSGKRVICPDIAGLAGAYGAALLALDRGGSWAESRPLQSFQPPPIHKRRESRCGGCENRCPLTLLTFSSGARHVSGNRCERVVGRSNPGLVPGEDFVEQELRLLLDRPLVPEQPGGLKIGMPLALNTFENLPFWASLLTGLGHQVVLPRPTDEAMMKQAAAVFCSDSVCLPAKTATAQVRALAGSEVDLIFFPQVLREAQVNSNRESYNCPIVTGYPEAAASGVDPAGRFGTPIATPPVSFDHPQNLRASVRKALAAAGIPARGFNKALLRAVEEQRRFAEGRLWLGSDARKRARETGKKLMVLACRPYHLDPFLHYGIPRMLTELGFHVVSSQCFPGDKSADAPLQVLSQWSFNHRGLDAARLVISDPDLELVQINSFGCGPDAMLVDETSEMLESVGRWSTVLRVDEGTAPGSVRLRLRTMAMALASTVPGAIRPRRTTPPFLETDRRRTILAPTMEPMLAHLLAHQFHQMGYRLEVLPETNQDSTEWGLRHVNNEICYPAILTIGDMLKALGSGKYPLDEVALCLSQSGGQCRASNYVPLLKKALVTAGFGQVPVISFDFSSAELNDQPGFDVGRKELVRFGLPILIVSDAVSMMVRALAPRERVRGTAQATGFQLLDEWMTTDTTSREAAVEFIALAARTLGAVEVERQVAPRIGIVGEVYLKYAPFSNHHIVDWLSEQGFEAVLPALTLFFLQDGVNFKARKKHGMEHQLLPSLVWRYFDWRVDRYLEQVNEALAVFPWNVAFPYPGQVAASAEQVIALTNQYGEGWLLPGEIVHMVETGIRDVICLQPFGCIANQVVARGIEPRLKRLFPDLNIQVLDLDHNTSKANFFNRLKLLVEMMPPPGVHQQPPPKVFSSAL